MSEHAAEKDAPRATVAEAIAAWEAKGPTSLTVALMADALYGVRESLSARDERTSIEFDGLTHDCDNADCHVPAFVTTLRSRVASPDVH